MMPDARDRFIARVAALLVRHGIVQPGAVEDPQGYDACATMHRIVKFAQALIWRDRQHTPNVREL